MKHYTPDMKAGLMQELLTGRIRLGPCHETTNPDKS